MGLFLSLTYEEYAMKFNDPLDAVRSATHLSELWSLTYAIYAQDGVFEVKRLDEPNGSELEIFKP